MTLTKVLTAGAIAAGIALTPATASAQDSSDEKAVDATGKGMVGGGLLGAEVVMIGIAIGGVKAWWPYVVFGAVGAGAGVAGGYFVETEVARPEPALYMLAGGMALIVPTLVAVLNATAYEPEDDEVEEADDLPAGEEEFPGVEIEAGAETGLISIDAFRKHTRVRPGVPAVKVIPSHTNEYGIETDHEVHMPIVSGRF